jgi:hypothetical protein
MLKSKVTRTLLGTAVLMALGSGAQAATLAAGSYTLEIQTWSNSTTTLKSAFAFGDASTCNVAPGGCGLTDNGVLVRGNGSSIAADGFSGKIGITVGGGGSFTVSSWNVDAYPNTAGGDFATWANSVAGMTGTIDGAGNMVLNPTGRAGTPDFFSVFDNGGLGERWNFDNSSISGRTATLAYSPFTTGTMCNVTPTGVPNTCLTGQALDGSMNLVLVSVANIGNDWGSFKKTPYSEIYSIHVVSNEVAAVPVPAAVWLFGSGLIGLVGIARRKKKA